MPTHTQNTHRGHHSMGFSSEWVSIMKGVVPQAFTPAPFTPNTRGAFIDGQIQLMKPQFITTMDLFFRVQYANMINRYLKDGPDDMVVVLAFDDYNCVPAAKSMTQSRRKQRVVDVMPFSEEDPLPMDRLVRACACVRVWWVRK